MHKLFFLLISIFLILSVNAQNQRSIEIPKNYLKFLPSNVDPNNLRPSDIPSEQVLRKFGLSDSEINEATNFKNGKGKYNSVNLDTLDSSKVLSKFYKAMGDSINDDSITYPKARIYGQDIFRNNNLIFYQKALDAKAPENYKVSSGDEVSIAVWGYSEFSETLLVDERGYITPSSYGRVYVKGLTFKKMRSLLKSRFSSFLDMKNSEIDVTLSYSRVITVNIVGEVYNPGSYTIPAINTAFNALIAAKGPNQIGTVRNIYIKRDGRTVDSLDVYQFLFDPKRSQDIYLQDGDYLFVPPAKHIIEVKGAVNRPYTYESKKGETVANLLNYAGGYSTNAFTDLITLKRIDYNLLKVNDVHKDDFTSTVLKNGDELVINSISNELSNVVSVKGSVGVEGDYEFINGERLLDLLKRSKSISDKTFLDQIYIIRLNKDRTKSHISVNLECLDDASHADNILLQEYDIVRVLSVSDFDDSFSVTVSGAVRKEGKFDYGEGISLRDILLKAGGLSQQAENSRVEVSRVMDYDISSNRLKPKRTLVKTINVSYNLLSSIEAQEFELQPFDQIFVREDPDFEVARNVILSGEVKYPGKYALLSKDEKISSVINRAGGLTKYAYLGGSKMYRVFDSPKRKQNSNLIISDLLKDSLMNNPELAILYREEVLRSKEEKLLRKYSSSLQTYNLVYMNLDRAMSGVGSKHNLVMMDGDSIIVPKTMDVVHIKGDLMNLEGNTISAPYFGSRRAIYYINNFAGGLSKENAKAKTVVIHPSGVAKRTLNFGLFVISPKVKKGSTIKVVNKPQVSKIKKVPLDWNEAIEKTMLKITAVLTLYLLIDRVAAQ